MSEIASKEHKDAAGMARDLLATYKNSEDLINIGAYVKGSNPKVDMAIYYHESILSFLKQGIGEQHSFEESTSILQDMFKN